MSSPSPNAQAFMSPDLDAVLTTKITLKHLTVQTVAVPHREAFRSAIGARRERRALLVRWTDHDDAWGLGECSCRPDPFFNGEFVDGALMVLRDYVFPRLPSHATVGEVVAVAMKMRGWPFTVAALLDALFDLMRRKGMADIWAAWPTPPQPRIPVGLSLPLFETAEAAVERVGEAVEAGFRRMKMKVIPGMDLAPLHAVRYAYPAIPLSFDANGTIGEQNLAFLYALAAFEPKALEQPFAPDRLDLCDFLKASFPSLRICLDESIDSLGALMTAHRLNALDELNLKPGRVGGPLATVHILDYCTLHAIPVWIGGMFETGIGRAANMRVAARLPEAWAHDLSPPHRYLAHDLVGHPLTMEADGYISFDDQPVLPDEAALERYTIQRIVLMKA